MPFVRRFIFKCKHCSKDFGFENSMHLHEAVCSKKPQINPISTQVFPSVSYDTRHHRSLVEPGPVPQQEVTSATRTVIDEGDIVMVKGLGAGRKQLKYPTRQSKPNKSNQEMTARSTVTTPLLKSAEKNAHVLEKPKEAECPVPKLSSSSKPKLDELPIPNSTDEKIFTASNKVFYVAADRDGTSTKKSESPQAKMEATTIKEAQHTDPQPVPSFKCNYCPKTFSRNLKRILHQQRGHYFTLMAFKSNLSTRRFGLQSRNETVFKKMATVSPQSVSESDCESSTSFESVSSSSSSSNSYETETASEESTGANVELQKEKLSEAEKNQPLFKSDAELLQYLTRVAVKGEAAYFICSICDNHIKSRDNANSHVRGHLGEKPFQCSYCDVSYASKKSRTKHEQKVHSRL